MENSDNMSRKAQLHAINNTSAARPVVDDMFSKYAAVITPSAPDEAPLEIEKMGSAAFCLIWTVSCFDMSNESRTDICSGSAYTGGEYFWYQKRKRDVHRPPACRTTLPR